MSKRRQVFNVGRFVLGLLLMLGNATVFTLECMHRSSDEFYLTGIKRYLAEKMWMYIVFFVIGVVFIWLSIHDFTLYRRYRLFQSVCARREYVEIRELAQESGCSFQAALCSVKQMIRKKLFPGAVLDKQQGMILLSKAALEAYQEAWEKWNQKQELYQKEGISLEHQEIFLKGKILTEEIQELAKEIEEPKIKKQLEKISQIYKKRYEQVEAEIKNVEFLNMVETEYLPQVKDMAHKYLQMEKLGENVKNTVVMEKFEMLLKNFPEDYSLFAP